MHAVNCRALICNAEWTSESAENDQGYISRCTLLIFDDHRGLMAKDDMKNLGYQEANQQKEGGGENESTT